MKLLIPSGGVMAAFLVGIAAGTTVFSPGALSPDARSTQVYELRTYTAAEGKHDALLSRFRGHTMRIFEKHGMENIGYWTPQKTTGSDNMLIYLLAHPSRAVADRSWEAFISDPEWQAVAEESQRDGRLVVVGGQVGGGWGATNALPSSTRSDVLFRWSYPSRA